MTGPKIRKRTRSEVVETGHELEIKIKSSGAVKLQPEEQQSIGSSGQDGGPVKLVEEGCW